jgi:ketosteroid isomerase-like protein
MVYSGVMTHDQIDAWIAKYVEAWRDNNASMLVDLFSDQATYREAPWSTTIQGLANIEKFWNEVCSSQGDFDIQSKIVAVEGATAEVHLSVTYKTDKPSQWRDVWVLTFDDDGLCDSYLGWPWPLNQL